MATDNSLQGPILVLGATSLIGRWLLATLREADLAPVAASRTPPPGEPGWVSLDLADPDLPARLPPAATVFALCPLWLLPAVLPALKARGLQRLVAFSSTSRFTKQDSEVPAERDVASRLAGAERAVEGFCAAQGVAWTILRPTLIYDEGRDGNVSRLAGLIRRFGVLPLAGDGSGLRQPVHAQDLALGAVAAAGAEAACDRSYNLVGGETLAYRDMAIRIFVGLARRPRILALPAPLFGLALRLASPLLPGATAAMGTRMSQDLTFDSADAVRDFGWAPRPFHPQF